MRLIKLPEVVRMTGVPASSVYWRASRGEFPRPVKLGPRASAWELEAVEQWIRAKLAAGSEASPATLRTRGAK